MQTKQILYLLATVLLCVTASAGEEFLLDYYVEVNQQGEEFVLQQHGRRLSTESAISTPIGRGGRGKFSLSLASLGESTGVLRMELYDDKPDTNSVKAPSYSLDIEFSKEGAKGDVVDTVDDINVEFSYSIVAQ